MDDQNDFNLRMNTSLRMAAVSDAYPNDDANDMAHGAHFIPGEVTLARRAGQPVNFVQACSNPCCWYWEFHDRRMGRMVRRPNIYGYDDDYTYERNSGHNRYKPGQRIYHFDRYHSETLRDKHNGTCPICGNTHISGATGVPLKEA